MELTREDYATFIDNAEKQYHINETLLTSIDLLREQLKMLSDMVSILSKRVIELEKAQQ